LVTLIVTIHQPAYLPWLGYLDKIYNSDVFVFFDTVQFKKHSFMNRNRIKTQNGEQWLTIPLNQHGILDKSLMHVEIDVTKPWKKKHWKSITQNYGKAKFFTDRSIAIESLFNKEHYLLTELCFEMLQQFLILFSIDTKVVRASSLGLNPDLSGSDLVLEICKLQGADKYISGSEGRSYLVEKDFQDHSIQCVYQEFRHPKYHQLHGEFLPNMACIDLLFNESDPLSILDIHND
jgi:hypothetical protein